MSSTTIGIATALALTASAVAPHPVSAFDARDMYLRCLATQTAALDDRRSPAETVARSVVSACLSEGRAMYAASSAGAKVLEGYDANALRASLSHFAVKVVGRYRTLQN
jgi:hypothetical protein